MDRLSGELHGKVALVTGATSETGIAIVQQVAAAGAKIIAVARREKLLNSLVVHIEDQGGSAEAMTIDLAHFDAVASAVKLAALRHGQLDILINNASAMELANLVDAKPKDLRQMIHVNFIGAISITQAAAQIMRDQGSGHIVNVCDSLDLRSLKGAAVYRATKYASGSFFQSIRRELSSSGIRVSVIRPGRGASDLLPPTEKTTLDSTKETDRSPTILEPEDVAAAVLYAISQPQRVNVDEIQVRPAANY